LNLSRTKGEAPITVDKMTAADWSGTSLALWSQSRRRPTAALRHSGVEPLDFHGQPTTKPLVISWTPPASVFFHDPDGHLPEYLAMPAYELALDEAAFHRTAFKPASFGN
jgi:hypothetical protein